MTSDIRDGGNQIAPRHFTRLCLDFAEDRLDKAPEADDFLQRNREPLGLEEGDGSLLTRFLRRIWPEGVPTTLVVSNISFDLKHPKWLLRPVSWGPDASRPAASHQTLGMEAYRRQGRLVVKRFELTPHVRPRDHEWVITAPLFWNSRELWMQAEDLDVLGQLPFHRVKTRDRLEGWREYLTWKEQLVKQFQVKIPYLGWSRLDDHRLAFRIQLPVPNQRRLDGQTLAATPPEVDTRQPRRRNTPPFRLGDVERVEATRPRDNTRGSEASEGQVIIRLDEDVAERPDAQDGLLPSSGVLVSDIAGDLSPLRNQAQAITRLQNSQGFCSRISDFLFDSTHASLPAGPPPELSPLPGTRLLNAGQAEAVAKALSAPDLCLIQGPPGTGKTTVIAELCLRVTHQGGRVLVSSQTNLAVDNALSRLADSPGIRRLRLGNADKVDADYQDFLADKVVDRWFTTILAACTERLEGTERMEQEQRHARQHLAALRQALNAHDASREAMKLLGERLGASKQEQDISTHRVQEARARKDGVQCQLEALKALQDWADGAQEPPVLPASLELPELNTVVQAVSARLPPEDPVRKLEGLALLTAVEARTQELDTLRGLLREGRRLCAEGFTGSGHAELSTLMAERRRLSLSEDEVDAARLPGVNRRIKQLQGAEWSRFTHQLATVAERVWPAPTPSALDPLIDSLQPAPELLPMFERLDVLATQAREAREQWARARPDLSRAFTDRAREARERLTQSDHDLRATEDDLGYIEAERAQWLEKQHLVQQDIDDARARWDAAWGALLSTREPSPRAPSSEAFDAAEAHAGDLHRDTEARRSHRQRWSEVQKEWCQRLGQVTESDRDQLQALYIRHANVVGMTCNEAGKKKHFEDPAFQPFDMVIIDEVSKATPTELIMPMLLGTRIVLVGDHRQLPPMFREKEASFEDARSEGAIDSATFQKYQRMVTASLFQELFEAAPDELKAMLWVQYRMHPQVMDVVNQFYGGRLQAGAGPDAADPRRELDARRQHHLRIPDGHGGHFLEPHQHLLWVDSSRDARQQLHLEQQQGTSKRNRLEVELVSETLRRLNGALKARGYGTNTELRVERADAGTILSEFIRVRLGQPPAPTLDDLFEEKRIRVDGRSRKPGHSLQVGETVQLDARRQVGVITFYGAQQKALREAIAREMSALDAMEVRTDTVDRFQGMERPIILASLVRSMKGNMGEFARQFQRLNVAFSRAQELLVIIGAVETFKHANVDLPSTEPQAGGATERKPVYQEIFNIAVREGGRRHAW